MLLSPLAAPESQAGGGSHQEEPEPLPELLRVPLPSLPPGKVRSTALRKRKPEGGGRAQS